MSMASSTGLSSGINYDDIISKLRQANSRPIYQVQQQAQKMQTQQAALQNVNKAVMAFKSKAESLIDRKSFLTINANSTDNTVIGASAKSDASTGNYSVKVRQLAQNNRIASQGVATSDDTPIANAPGKFEFKVGNGSTYSVDVTTGMTLQQLRDAVNTAAGGKVRASIVNDGTPTNPSRMVLTASDTGSANAINFVTNDTTLNLTGTTIEAANAKTGNTFNGAITSSGTYTGATTKNIVMQITTAGAVGAAKFKVSYDGGLNWSANDAFTATGVDQDITGVANEGVMVKFDPNVAPVDFAVGDRFTIDAFAPQLQKAQDALIEVDGVQISRETNVFENVVDGVTLTAKKVDDKAQTIDIAKNTGTALAKINEFVKAYNDLVKEVTAQTKYDVENKKASPLFGDSGVNGIVNNLRQVITQTISNNGSYNALSSIGITVDKTGALAVDAAKVGKAVTENLDAVMNLFIEAGVSTSSDVRFTKSTADTKMGSYLVNITTTARQATVTGSKVLADVLAADETLTFGRGETAISIMLNAGQTMSGILDTINNKFAEKSFGLQAVEEAGKLKLISTAYGSEEKFSVFSNRDAALANQLGIGLSELSDTGVDVAGTINGVAGKGSGQTLKAPDGTDAKGMELLISAKSPMTASINLSQGLALGSSRFIEGMSMAKTGFFAVRETGFGDRQKQYESRIEDLNARLNAQEDALRKKFNALETKLAGLQQQGSSLNSQLASLLR